MRKKILSWLSKAAMVLLLFVTIPQTVLAYSGIFDNFDSGTPGTAPVGWTTNGSVVISTDVNVSPSNSLKLQGRLNNAVSAYKTIDIPPENAVIEADVYTGSGDAGSLSLIESSGRWQARVLFRDGQVYYSDIGHDDQQLHSMTTYIANTWYHVKIVHDHTTKTFDVYIDDTLVKDNIAMYTSGDSTPTRLQLSSGNDSGSRLIYFDNVRLYDATIPEMTGYSVWRSDAAIATVRFMADKSGTSYYQITDSETPPVDVISGGTDAGTVLSNTTKEVSLNGLTAGSKYVHIVIKDSENNISNPLTIAMPYDYYYYENFETYPLDTYIASGVLSPLQQINNGTGDANQKVTEATDNESSKMLSLSSRSSWASDQVVLLDSAELANSGFYIFEGNVYPLGTDGWQLRLSFTNGNYEGANEAGIYFKNGNIVSISDSEKVLKTGYNANQWYRVKIIATPLTGKYAVHVDDVILNNSLTLPTGINRLAITSGHGKTAYFDNLKFYMKEAFSGGTGTAEDPYLISTPADLFELAQKAKSMDIFNGKYFKQTQNIDLVDNDDLYIPYFNGYYEGDGYHIENMTIDGTGSHYVGMIGSAGPNAVLQNITLENVDVRGNSYVGALVSYNEGRITGCYINGSITGIWATGGLAGYSEGWIEDCHVNVSVTGSHSMTGGLIGYAVWCNIDQCSAAGNVEGVEKPGGLIGYLQGGSLSNSYAKVNVTASSQYSKDIGGLVGCVDASNGFTTNISNCYSHSNIFALNDEYDDKYIGGLFGANYWGTASNCYAAGSITASGSGMGGLTGIIYAGTITTDSYYDSELSGLSDLGKGKPKSTDEMKRTSTYENWSFPDVWTLSSDNDGYPALAWQGFTHVSLSDDATLSELSASGMTITPAFNASVTNYSANITNNISSTTITAISASGTATVKINGVVSTNKKVSLNEGNNIITIEVTAQDGVTLNTYTININRESYVPVENQKPVLTSDWNYTTVYFDQNYPFTITVTDYENTPNTLLYIYIDDAEPNQQHNFSEVPGTVNITLSPLKGVLSAGSHTLNFYAVDAGGAVSSVLVLPFTIEEQTSSEASLSSISLTGIKLVPTFNSETLNYTASVNNSITTTTVTAIAVSENATIEINGTSGNSKEVSLNAENNLITVVVTAEDRVSSKTYTIDITREDIGSGDGGGSSYRYYTIAAKAEKGGKISPSGNISVRQYRDKDFTITANEGYVIFDVLVDGKSVGAVDNYTFKDVSKAHTITAKFAEEVKEELEEPESPYMEIPFIDVSQNDWFANDVMWAYKSRLMNGTSSTTFDPHGITTRGMIVTILYRLEGSPTPGTNTFIDVEAGKYYANAVAWAAKNEIVKGYGNGKFGPEDPITREQLAVILVNYAKYKGYDVSSRADLSKFADFVEVSNWAGDAMSWASFEKLIHGDGNRLLPSGNAERAQAAAILHRFVEYITNSSN